MSGRSFRVLGVALLLACLGASVTYCVGDTGTQPNGVATSPWTDHGGGVFTRSVETALGTCVVLWVQRGGMIDMECP